MENEVINIILDLGALDCRLKGRIVDLNGFDTRNCTIEFE